VGSIAVDPNNQRVIYVGTGEGDYGGDNRYGTGILKSSDGGNSWSVVSRGPNDAFFRRCISSLFVDPTNSNTLYASVIKSRVNTNPGSDNELGIYKSTDAGRTWARITDDTHIGNAIAVTSLDYTWAAPNTLTIYAGIR